MLKLTKNERHMIERKCPGRANSESENESLITVKDRQSISLSFFLTLLLLKGNSTSAHAHLRHRMDPVTGKWSLLQVLLPLTA